MYYAHFGLKEPPFKITPNTEFFFSGGNRGAILDALIYAINGGEGIVKVVGEVGSGKTMLCRMLQTLLPEKVESIYLANPSMAPEDVLHAIAFELQLKLPKNADRLKVMQLLQNYLLEHHAEGRQVVVFVEEAQGMPLATLEELRLLSNLETGHDKLLQIVLFGQPELDKNLNEVQIRQLRERITHSFNLGPLTEDEVGEYIIFRLRAAGYFGPHLFTKSAIRKLSNVAQGLVRRVNILADKSLLAAFSENVYQVTPKHVSAAINDSEFGAIPSSTRFTGKWLYAAVAATLLAGLGLGYFLSQWHTKTSHPASQQVNETAKARNNPSVDSKPTTVPVLKLNNATVAAEVLSAAQQAAIVSEPTDILEQRIEATKTWLNTHPASTVSIQVLGSANDGLIKAQLEGLGRQLGGDNIYVFRTRVGSKPYVSILYGSYASRGEALQAMGNLPESIRAGNPQIRTVGGILKEIANLQEVTVAN